MHVSETALVSLLFDCRIIFADSFFSRMFHSLLFLRLYNNWSSPLATAQRPPFQPKPKQFSDRVCGRLGTRGPWAT